ncbi:hypothetical protein OU579_27485, partial [Escherichia coli]|nr:hypothetical protein [Escherichia coli]
SAQIREILINESAWEEMTCLFAPSLDNMTLHVRFHPFCEHIHCRALVSPPRLPALCSGFHAPA